ncbi:hypothetical protein D0T50_06590 [Bacteroides sp. 214]|nr:hypothetical protein [Bacteroides sp. 214]
MVFLSCNNNELTYSCDRVVDKWAHENLAEIKQMTRAEFLSIEPNYQKAAFRIFTPEQRKEIWISKLKDALLLEWSKAESEHLQEFIRIIDSFPTLYTHPLDGEEKDLFDICMYKWFLYAQEVLSWDLELINAILVNPNKLINTKGDIENPLTRGQNTSLTERNCNCYYNPVFINDCVYSECFKTKCTNTWPGCGIAGAGICDGECAF